MNFPQAILFDLDGVLLDSEYILCKAWRETAKEFNYNLSEDKLSELQGRTKTDCAKKIIEWINKELSVEEILSIQKLKLKNKITKAKSFKGSKDLIEFCLKIKLPIALVTSSSRDSFKKKSSINPWLNLFEIKILGDDEFVYKGKPAPDPYLKAIERLDVDPKSTWVVEDSYSGSLAGLRAGCNLYYFSKNIKIENKLTKEFPKNKIQRINELAEIIYFLKLYKGF